MASCGVASLVLGLKCGVGLFYVFDGLKVDKGSNIGMDEVSLKDLSKASLHSGIKVSTGIKAGVDAYIGAKAGLEVLIAGIEGTGTIDIRITAIKATAQADVQSDFSVDKGLQLEKLILSLELNQKSGLRLFWVYLYTSTCY